MEGLKLTNVVIDSLYLNESQVRVLLDSVLTNVMSCSSNMDALSRLEVIGCIVQVLKHLCQIQLLEDCDSWRRCQSTLEGCLAICQVSKDAVEEELMSWSEEMEEIGSSMEWIHQQLS